MMMMACDYIHWSQIMIILVWTAEFEMARAEGQILHA
jgi:hypothetical protein